LNLESAQLRGKLDASINALIGAAAINFGKLFGFLLTILLALFDPFWMENPETCAA
jgi:hypothetical protein